MGTKLYKYKINTKSIPQNLCKSAEKLDGIVLSIEVMNAKECIIKKIKK